MTRGCWRLVIALLLAVPVVATTSAPALACSCVFTTLADRVADPADVFVAMVEEPPTLDDGLLYAPATVVEVFRGDVPARITVLAGGPRDPCDGGPLPTRQPLLFTGTSRTATYSSGLCGGTEAATPGVLERVERLVGPGRRVTPPSSELPTDQPSDDNTPADTGEEKEGPVLWLAGVSGILAIGIGAAAFWYSRRR